MSGGYMCNCKDHKCPKHRKKYWRISQYQSNRSAFNGYRETYSRYSEIICKSCGSRWRTTAKYVSTLLHATRKELLASPSREVETEQRNYSVGSRRGDP